MSFNDLISENFQLQSGGSHAYVTQQVSSHSDEHMSRFTELCAFLISSYLCATSSVLVKLNGYAVSTQACNHKCYLHIFVSLSICYATLNFTSAMHK